jgi:hypothetical protein
LTHSNGEEIYPGCISIRARKAFDEPEFYWIAADREDYRNGRSRPFCCHRRRGSARGDHRYLTMNQLGSHYRQLIIATLSPTKFNRYILIFDIAKFTQALAECPQSACVG